MKVLILQHTATEGAGGILDWCVKQHAEITYIHLYKDNPNFDSTLDYDLMVILGGPMSVNDESQLSWLKPEKQFVREMIATSTPVLGLCLGAQMIATVLGAKVKAGSQNEVGWHPVSQVASDQDVFKLPENFDFFHWHNETFELPHNAIRLAESEACSNQGYQIGDKVIGLQFHPEVTVDTMQQWIKDDDGMLKTSAFVQTPTVMTRLAAKKVAPAHNQLYKILDYLVREK